MLGHTRRQAQLLERYWAVLRRDTAAAAPPALDSDTADTLARVARLRAELQPPAAVVAEGRERLARAAAEIGGRRAWSGPAIEPRATARLDRSPIAEEMDEPRIVAVPETDAPDAQYGVNEQPAWGRELLKLAAAVLVFGVVATVLVLVLRREEPQTAMPLPTPTTVVAPTTPAQPTTGTTPSPITGTETAGATPSATIAATATSAAPPPDVSEIGELEAVIPVAGLPGAMEFAAGSLWVTHPEEGTVSRINPATDSVVATIEIGESQPGIASAAAFLAATDEAIWVIDEVDGAIVRIDPATNQIAATLPLPQTGRIGIAVRGIAAGHGSLWLTDFSSNSQVLRINPDSGAVEALIEVETPQGIAVSADAVWVANYQSTSVTRIDQATNAVVATVQVGGAPVAVTIGEGAVWVGNRSSGSVSRIDPATNQVVATVTIYAPGSTSSRIQVGRVVSAAGAVWVAEGDESMLYRIDPATNQLVAEIEVAVLGLAGNADSLWISNPPSSVLRVALLP